MPEPVESASFLQCVGACGFGAVLGWYVYYINRYRKDDIKLGDLTTLVGVVGGGAVLALFPAGTSLFGAYGLGLFFGFFGYLWMLFRLVRQTDNFTVEWFLDGRRKKLPEDMVIPEGARQTVTAMGDGDDAGKPRVN